MRLIYMGSPAPAIAPLAYLLETQIQHGHQLLAVISQPATFAGRGRKKILLDPPVANFAKEKGLLTLQPEKARDPDFLAQLRDLRPDVIITCAYGQILSREFLSIPSRATINIHPSRLPEYRGATPVQAAILAGDSSTAVSVLFTVQALDAGAIIVQKEYPIPATARAGELMESLFTASGALLLSALDKLGDPKFLGLPQDESKVSTCRKIDKSMGLIDWQLPAATIYNRFRAFHPWPGTFCQMAGVQLLVEGMSVPNAGEGMPDSLNGLNTPGAWRYLKAQRVLAVRAGDAWLYLETVKPAGGKILQAHEFYNGYLVKKGLKEGRVCGPEGST